MKIRSTLFLFLLASVAHANSDVPIRPGIQLAQDVGANEWTSGGTTGLQFADSVHGILGVRLNQWLLGLSFEFDEDIPLSSNTVGTGFSSLGGSSTLYGLGGGAYFDRFYALGIVAFLGSYSLQNPGSQYGGFSGVGLGQPLSVRFELGFAVFESIYAELDLSWASFHQIFESSPAGLPDVDVPITLSAFGAALGISVHY